MNFKLIWVSEIWQSNLYKKTYFACFADGSNNIKNAGLRILNQALESSIFEDCFLFDKKKLFALKPFEPKVDEIMNQGVHGFGYFVWKPILIRTLLETVVPEGCNLVYVDSGTELVSNRFAKRRMIRLISKLEDQPVIAFQTKFPEYFYTKSNCLSLLKNPRDQITNQTEATALLIKNCNESRKILAEWEDYATKDNFVYLNDILSDEQVGFIEHRWDQSIFSVLYKNAEYKSLRMRQVFGYLHENTKITVFRRFRFNSFFLWQIRNRSGESILKRYQSNTLISLIFLPLQYLITPIEYLNQCKKRIFYKFKVIISRITTVQQ